MVLPPVPPCRPFRRKLTANGQWTVSRADVRLPDTARWSRTLAMVICKVGGGERVSEGWEGEEGVTPVRKKRIDQC